MPKKTSHVERLKSGLYGNYSEIVDDISGFCDMSIDEANTALRGAVSLAVNHIAEIAGRNLVSAVKGANGKLPEGGSLYKGIRAYVYKDLATGMVHILGDKKVNDGTWRTRFFEAGTKERYHKKKTGVTKSGRPKYSKGKSVGHISETWFFRDALTEGTPEIEDIMTKHLEKKIEQLAA